jgi:hypothetical protein
MDGRASRVYPTGSGYGGGVMQTDGRTLRQHGTLRLVALRAGATEERYVLMQDGHVVAGGFPSLAAAGAHFERLQRAALRQAGPAPPADGAAAAPPAEANDAGNVVSMEAYRRRRR